MRLCTAFASLLLGISCAARRDVPKAAADPASAALKHARTPYQAEQRLHYEQGETQRDGRGRLFVFPGVGYRVIVSSEEMQPLLDVTIRCDRFAIDEGPRHAGGSLAELDGIFPAFPFRALAAALDLAEGGTWNEETYTAVNGAMAELRPGHELFGVSRVPSVLELTVLAEAKSGEHRYPARMHLQFAGGASLDVEQSDAVFDRALGKADDVLSAVRCDT